MPGLIRFRWIAIVCLLIGSFPLSRWGFLEARSLPYFFAVLFLLAVFNILSLTLWPREESARQKHILINLWVDLLAAAGLLFVSGSANNPFISILCIHSFLGGMILRSWASYFFGATVLFLLGLLQIETYMASQYVLGVDTSEMFVAFLSQWVLITASWFVSHFFSGLLNKNEQRIRLLQDRQHQADRLKSLGALTAGFSHQLATPMNSLKLRMERGLRKLSSNQTEAREEFDKAQNSLEECVEVFKHMASVFSRSAQAELQTVDLNDVASDLLSSWSKENQDMVVEKVFSQQELRCRLQVLAFSYSFFDLLNNASESSQCGGVVTVRLYQQNSWIVLEVTDQGEGLSEEILSRLGEPFVTSKEDGNGLGLYSATMMAQASGGEFKIFNNISGVGATAQIRLPLDESAEGARI